jgi:AcrR family transcriptional regulator
MAQTPSTTDTRSRLTELMRPPMRTDARRNYEALLSAANEIFSVRGPDAPLDEIARRAGVGNATLYRHFPTRRELLVAVCIEDVEELCALGERLQRQPSADGALTRWLRAYIKHVSSKHGLAAAFATGRREDSEFVTACHDAIYAVGSSLLERAQRDDEIRRDVNVVELITLVNAIAIATESQGVKEANRLLGLVFDGISPSR